MRYSHGDRDPSFDYRYRKMREFSSRPFKFDISAPGMETDGGIGNASFDGLDDDYGNATSPNLGTLSQKTKDFIGENLLDIENTLKALNLDFLQTFTEMEKNDSAETLFGDTYAYDSNVSPKMLTTAKLPKMPTNYSSIEVSPKSTKSSQYSPLDKHLSQQPFDGVNQYFNDSGSNDKMVDGKRSSTPDTGFASRETNVSSRRGSQKSSYSPQDTHFSPNYTSQLDEARAAYAQLKSNGSFPSRQRSMSFTENYNLKSPVLSEPPTGKFYQPGAVGRTNSSDSQAVRRRQRNTISHRPKSIRARNLRRLSYNPIILDSSSSSSDDNDYTRRSIENIRNLEARRSYSHRYSRHSMASPTKSSYEYEFRHWHNSESDIRLKNRRSAQFQSNSSITPSHLYGSNASIKSAPQYNNFANDHHIRNYPDRKYFEQMEYDEVAEQRQLQMNCGSSTEQSAHRQSFRRRQPANIVAVTRNYAMPTSPPAPTPPPATQQSTVSRLIQSAFSPYNQFDVSKLTGKSPTTQSFLQDVDPATAPTNYEQSQYRMQSQTPSQQSSQTQSKPGKKLPQTPQHSTTTIKFGGFKFQWPEKIHVSAVAAQNSNTLWKSSATPTTQSQSAHPVNSFK